MIVMKNLFKSYPVPGQPPACVLRDVSLHIRPGAYAAFVGPSGSGKSTLMHIMGCLDTPTQGRYFLDGTDVSTLRESALCRIRGEKIGFVFQGYQLMAQLTAEENVAFPLMLRGMEEEKRLRIARQELRRMGLSGREHHRPWQLSGGQQQRVALARALCTRPRLLLCDEPTGALDERSRDDILDTLDELHRDGHTIVLITHDACVAARAVQRFRVQDGSVTPCTAQLQRL